MIEVINELSGFDLSLEHDGNFDESLIGQKVIDSIAAEVLVIGGIGAVQDCHYIEVVTPYDGELSPGQREVYDILLTIQQTSVYASLTIGRLAEFLKIGVLPTSTRLHNLRSLRAIYGFKLR